MYSVTFQIEATMKTDLYSKVVLTVIAGCLFYNVVKDIVGPAWAQTDTPVDVNIAAVNGIKAFHPLEVKLAR